MVCFSVSKCLSHVTKETEHKPNGIKPDISIVEIDIYSMTIDQLLFHKCSNCDIHRCLLLNTSTTVKYLKLLTCCQLDLVPIYWKMSGAAAVCFLIFVPLIQVCWSNKKRCWSTGQLQTVDQYTVQSLQVQFRLNVQCS